MERVLVPVAIFVWFKWLKKPFERWIYGDRSQ